MSSAIEVHAAALRVAQVTGDEALELAQWMCSDEGRLEDAGWYKSEVATRLGYERHTGQLADRLEFAAGALIIAAEFARMTPFERWFKTKHTEAERKKLSARDIDMMRIGFTKYGTENQ